jgi:hypothetical protein
MKLLALAAAAIALGSPSKTIQLAIVHTVQGCHVWSTLTKQLGPSPTLTVKAGTKIQIRISCPMNFMVTQVKGPALAIGDPMFYTGTVRTIVFPQRGVYVLRATNMQSSSDMGLQTLGPDNTPTLTVRAT